MCYVDDGSFQSVMQFGDLGTHLYTKFSIQVGQRLVHQEYLRGTNDSTSHGNTLSLTTGQSLRFTIKQFLQVKDLSSVTNSFVDLVLRNFSQFQTECHVVIYGHMRIQSVVLEYHCDITILRLYVVHNFAVDFQSTFGNLFQTCNHTQCSRFTTSGRSYENDELLISDLQVEIFNSFKSVRISFVNSF